MTVKNSYFTVFNIEPVKMLLGLINNNNNLSLTEASVKIKPPVVIANAPEVEATHNGAIVKITRNTSVDIDVLTDEVAEDFVTFKYQRVDLATLFSLIEPSFLETSVDVGADGLISEANLTKFYDEIKRKYGVLLNSTDFTQSATANENTITISAVATNLAYTGSVVIHYTPTLPKRVLNKVLDGFTNPKA